MVNRTQFRPSRGSAFRGHHSHTWFGTRLPLQVNITGDTTVGRKRGHTGCSEETQGTTIRHGHFRVRCPVLRMSGARTLPWTWAVPQAWVRRCASSPLPASPAHLRSGHTQPTPRLPASSLHSAPFLEKWQPQQFKKESESELFPFIILPLTCWTFLGEEQQAGNLII